MFQLTDLITICFSLTSPGKFSSKINTIKNCSNEFLKPICSWSESSDVPCNHTFCLHCFNQYGLVSGKSAKASVKSCFLCKTSPILEKEKLDSNAWTEFADEPEEFTPLEELGSSCVACQRLNNVDSSATTVSCNTACDLCQVITKVNEKMSLGQKCETHSDEEVRIYCFDCKSVGCQTCLKYDHFSTHRWENLPDVFDQLKVRLSTEMNFLEEAIQQVNEKETKTNGEYEEILHKLDSKEKDIKEKRKAIHDAVDLHISFFAGRLKNQKVKKSEGFNEVMEEMKFQKSALVTLRDFMQNVITTAEACVLARVTDELIETAKMLHQTPIIDTEENVNDYFPPYDINCFMETDKIIRNIASMLVESVLLLSYIRTEY